MDKTLHYIVILSVAITATQTSCCREYKWGGVTGLHFFICCDNSNDIDKSCIGTTYQGGGSTNNYCDTCGQSNRLGGGCVKKTFCCTSCTRQDQCRRHCNRKANGLYQNIPGFCWIWTYCFRKCCEKTSAQRGVYTEDIEFCGDYTCQPGEDHVTCPSDCCPIANPDQCRCLSGDSCTDECCNEPSCCMDANANTCNSPTCMT